MSNLPDVCSEAGIRISRVPLVRDIMGPTHYEFDVDIRPGRKSGPVRKERPSATKPVKTAANQSKTFLTPIVNRIARDFFEGSLEVAQSALDNDANDDEDRETQYHKSHYSNPKVVSFKERLSGHEGHYQSAVIDGVTYTVSCQKL